jgi:hypothetical protein
MDFHSDQAVFSVFRRTSEVPLYRIVKDPSLRNRQGVYSVVAATGLILKRGPELDKVLRVLDKPLQVGVVTEARIDPVVVERVVAVRRGLEHRSKQQPVQAEIDNVLEPCLDPVEAMVHGRLWRSRSDGGTDEAQRVNVPPHRVAHPIGLTARPGEMAVM